MANSLLVAIGNRFAHPGDRVSVIFSFPSENCCDTALKLTVINLSDSEYTMYKSGYYIPISRHIMRNRQIKSVEITGATSVYISSMLLLISLARSHFKPEKNNSNVL
jgi:hypothetical protein